MRSICASSVCVHSSQRSSVDAALRARAFHHWLDDVVDWIPQGPHAARTDAPRNIGSGTLQGLETSLQLPLGRLLPGGQFNLSGLWQNSSVRDPVTLAQRPISDLVERKGKAELRQDLPAARLSWAVGFTAESAAALTHLTMLSILDDAETRQRRFYTPDRAGSLSSIEVGQRHPGYWWLLGVAGSL